MNNTRRFLIVYVLFIAVALVINFHTDIMVPTNRPFSEFPEQVHSWHMSKRNEFSGTILSVLKTTDYLYREYTDAGKRTVGLYIGYHGGGKDSGGIHSPKHCLPGSGWYEVSSRAGVLEVSGSTINLVRAVYQKGESKELFIYWFQVQGRTISNEYYLKVAEIVNSALHRRRDTAFIRVSVPVSHDVNQAVALGEQFIIDFEPLLRDYLPR